jgi:hypothetical protein
MRCAATVVLPKVANINEAAEKGTAIHEFLRQSKELGRDVALANVHKDYQEICEAIDLSNFPVFTEEYAEMALAYDIQTGVSRLVGINVGRNYGERRSPSEIFLSIDYVGVAADKLLVLDWKSGQDTTNAKENWQIRLGVLAVSKLFGYSLAVGALAYTRHGRPRYDAADFTAFDLDIYEEALKKAYAGWLVQDDSQHSGYPLQYVTGAHCKYCPSISYCSAQTALVKNLAGVSDIVGQLTPESASKALKVYRQYETALSEAKKVLDAYATNTPIALGNGMYYGEKVGGGRESVDADKAFEYLKKTYGDEVANKAVTLSASKTDIEAALKPLGVKDKAMKEMRAIKAIEFKPFGPRMGDFKRE